MEWLRQRREVRLLKSRIEEIDSDIRRIKDIRKRLQEDKGLLLKQREMMGRDIDAIIKDRQELLRAVPAAERLAFSERTLSYIALKTNISSGDSIKKDYKGLLLSEMEGKEYYLILEKKQIKRQISELSPWITNRYIIFSVCIMPVYFMYMYGWWMRVNGE